MIRRDSPLRWDRKTNRHIRRGILCDMSQRARIRRVISKNQPISSTIDQGLGRNALCDVGRDEMHEAINPPNISVINHTRSESSNSSISTRGGRGCVGWVFLLLPRRIVQSTVESRRKDPVYGIGNVADGQGQRADPTRNCSWC